MAEVQVRRLVESTLWKEDVYVLGHRSVWGSWYDAQAKHWGYECCRSSEKGAECSAAPAAAPAARDSSDDDADRSDATDSDEAEAFADKAADNIDWRGGPPELLAREALETQEDNREPFVVHFVRFGIGGWRRFLEGGMDGLRVDPGVTKEDLGGFKDKKSLEQVEAAMGLLLRKVRRGEMKPVVLGQLDTLVSLAAERKYADANKAYMQMVLGNKKWNNTLASYGGASGTNKGARIYITKQDDLLEYDKDPTMQRYVQAMRKVIQFVQCILPSSDATQFMTA